MATVVYRVVVCLTVLSVCSTLMDAVVTVVLRWLDRVSIMFIMYQRGVACIILARTVLVWDASRE